VSAACFDELAEKGGIAYSFEDIEVTSWSDRRASPSRRGSRRRRREQQDFGSTAAPNPARRGLRETGL